MMHGLHQLTSPEVSSTAKMIARAFAEDPLFSLFYYSLADQKKYEHLFYEFLLKFGLISGEVYASSPSLEGVIIWLKEGEQASHTWDVLRSGMLSIWNKIDVDSVLKYTQFTSQIHQKHVQEPHWYLQLLAVDPVYQHQGIGKKLMLPMLRQCDTDTLCCYLETQNQVNVNYYQEFGFRVVETTVLPDTHVQLWCMLRKPSLSS